MITLGSATFDVFVRSDSESRKHNSHLDICYHKGEKILIDELHFSEGGGGLNTAIAFSRLGLKTGFIGILGNDIHAEIIREKLKKERVNFLGKQKSGNSGYSVVLLDNSERTILTYKGVNNNLEWADIPAHKLRTSWIYLSTMIGKSFLTVEKLSSYSKRKDVSIAANISAYEASKGLSRLSKLLENIDVLILNKEEAETLCKTKGIRECSSILIKRVRKIIVITNGSAPIHIRTKNSSYVSRINKIKSPRDMTGAGDAFASGFLYGIIKNKSIETAARYGKEESLSVIQKIGANAGLLRELE